MNQAETTPTKKGLNGPKNGELTQNKSNQS